MAAIPRRELPDAAEVLEEAAEIEPLCGSALDVLHAVLHGNRHARLRCMMMGPNSPFMAEITQAFFSHLMLERPLWCVLCQKAGKFTGPESIRKWINHLDVEHQLSLKQVALLIRKGL